MEPIDNKTRDTLMTAYLYQALRQLPYDIEGLEVIGVKLADDKRNAEMTLEDAELNANMQALNETYKNADLMKQAVKNAVATDPKVKAARKELINIEGELETNEVSAKAKRREFQAAVALAELHSARINAMHRNKTTG